MTLKPCTSRAALWFVVLVCVISTGQVDQRQKPELNLPIPVRPGMGAIALPNAMPSRTHLVHSKEMMLPAGDPSGSLNASSTFLEAPDYDSGGTYANSVAVADVNGDGKLDLLVANNCTTSTSCSSGGDVGVLLGNGAAIQRIGINKCARESGFDRKNFVRRLVRGLPVKRTSYNEFLRWLAGYKSEHPNSCRPISTLR